MGGAVIGDMDPNGRRKVLLSLKTLVHVFAQEHWKVSVLSFLFIAKHNRIKIIDLLS